MKLRKIRTNLASHDYSHTIRTRARELGELSGGGSKRANA
jgi:HAMP domain-containing protein